MGQIGEPLKVVDIPRPEVAPKYDPPARTPEVEPLPAAPEPVSVPVPVKAPAKAPVKVPEEEPALV